MKTFTPRTLTRLFLFDQLLNANFVKDIGIQPFHTVLDHADDKVA